MKLSFALLALVANAKKADGSCKKIDLADAFSVGYKGEGSEATASVTCANGGNLNGKDKTEIKLTCECDKKGKKCKWANENGKQLSGKDMNKWFCEENEGPDDQADDEPNEAPIPNGEKGNCKALKLADVFSVEYAGEGKKATASVSCANGGNMNGKDKQEMNLKCKCDKKGKCKWNNENGKTLSGKDMEKWFCEEELDEEYNEEPGDEEPVDEEPGDEEPVDDEPFITGPVPNGEKGNCKALKLDDVFFTEYSGEGKKATASVTCINGGNMNGKDKQEMNLKCKCDKKGKCKWTNENGKILFGKDIDKWFCEENVEDEEPEDEEPEEEMPGEEPVHDEEPSVTGPIPNGENGNCKALKLEDIFNIEYEGEGKKATASVSCANGSNMNGKDKTEMNLKCKCDKKGKKCKWTNDKGKQLSGKDMEKWFCENTIDDEVPENEDPVDEEPEVNEPLEEEPADEEPTEENDEPSVAGPIPTGEKGECKALELNADFFTEYSGEGKKATASITCANGGNMNGKDKQEMTLKCKCDKKGKCKWTNDKGKVLSGKDMEKWFCEDEIDEPEGEQPDEELPGGDNDEPEDVESENVEVPSITGPVPSGEKGNCKALELDELFNIEYDGEGKKATAFVTCADGGNMNGKEKTGMNLKCKCDKKGKCKWTNEKGKVLSGKDMAEWFCEDMHDDESEPEEPNEIPTFGIDGDETDEQPDDDQYDEYDETDEQPDDDQYDDKPEDEPEDPQTTIAAEETTTKATTTTASTMKTTTTFAETD